MDEIVMDKFEDFILFDRLEEQLGFLDACPDKITSALCFHGLPGIGKTSFAKYFAKKHAKCVTYMDVSDWTQFKKHAVYKDWKRELVHIDIDSNYREDKKKYFDRALILDEWGDLSNVAQTWWKLPLQEMQDIKVTHDFKMLVIICLNTSPYKKEEKLNLENQMIPAIRSRCGGGRKVLDRSNATNIIDFCPRSGEEDSVVDAFTDRYPHLSDDDFASTYPDLRAVVAAGEKSNAMYEWKLNNK